MRILAGQNWFHQLPGPQLNYQEVVGDWLGRGQTEVDIHISLMPCQGRSRVNFQWLKEIRANPSILELRRPSNQNCTKGGVKEQLPRYGGLDRSGDSGTSGDALRGLESAICTTHANDVWRRRTYQCQ
jgi:hypothetical protein